MYQLYSQYNFFSLCLTFSLQDRRCTLETLHMRLYSQSYSFDTFFHRLKQIQDYRVHTLFEKGLIGIMGYILDNLQHRRLMSIHLFHRHDNSFHLLNRSLPGKLRMLFRECLASFLVHILTASSSLWWVFSVITRGTWFSWWTVCTSLTYTAGIPFFWIHTRGAFCWFICICDFSWHCRRLESVCLWYDESDDRYERTDDQSERKIFFHREKS